MEFFRPYSDILLGTRRSFTLADRTLTNIMNPTVLVDGEWLTLNAAERAVRAANIGAAGNVPAATDLCFPVWSPQGATDAQVSSMVPLIWAGAWEFETRIFDAAAAVGAGAAISARWQPLKVASITLNGRNYSGLVGHGGVGVDPDRIVAHVTRLAVNNRGWLRIRGGAGY